jgi:hypothetical protein
MREVVYDINRSDDSNNDFLFANNIRIADYMDPKDKN